MVRHCFVIKLTQLTKWLSLVVFLNGCLGEETSSSDVQADAPPIDEVSATETEEEQVLALINVKGFLDPSSIEYQSLDALQMTGALAPMTVESSLFGGEALAKATEVASSEFSFTAPSEQYSKATLGTLSVLIPPLLAGFQLKLAFDQKGKMMVDVYQSIISSKIGEQLSTHPEAVPYLVIGRLSKVLVDNNLGIDSADTLKLIEALVERTDKLLGDVAGLEGEKTRQLEMFSRIKNPVGISLIEEMALIEVEVAGEFGDAKISASIVEEIVRDINASLLPPPPATTPIPTPPPTVEDEEIQLKLISGLNASSLDTIYYDPTGQTSYAVTDDNIFVLDYKVGSAAVLADQYAGGSDGSTKSAWDATNRALYHRCQIDATQVKLCKSTSSSSASPLDQTAVVTNLNTSGDDDISAIIVDEQRNHAYVTGNNGSGPIIVRVPGTASASAKVTSTASLLGGGHYCSSISKLNLIKSSGDLYLITCGINGGTFCHLKRIKTTDVSSSPIAVGDTNGLNYTRNHTNQYPNIVHVDQVQETVYITSPTSYWSQFFRIDSSTTSSAQVLVGDAIESLVASGGNGFGRRAGSDANDIHYLAAGAGTSGYYKLFRLSSSVTSAAKITAAHALTNLNPGGSDGVAEAVYDESKGKLYFSGFDGVGTKIYRLSDTTVSAAPITPDQRLSNIVPSGDDAVASLNIIESQDAVVFIAEPTAGNKKLYLLSSASTATPNLSKISDFIAGGNDSPTILKVDAINNVLFVGIQTTASIRQLAVIPFSKLSPNLVVADYIIAQDDMTGGPDMISTAAATGWAWVRMIDGSGAKHLYRIEL